MKLLDKQKLLMRRALELIKGMDQVTTMFQHDKAYQEQRRIALMEEYAQTLTELFQISADAVAKSGSMLEAGLLKETPAKYVQMTGRGNRVKK